ncbi:sigma-70 family RNA polymerase sigma factor [Nocardia sp. NPDC051463]|uniref:sigma-70 family RNA polymerase sigma factor n=1 Tax=Nocardia sp. NPDC051463 TaxID=3154845 RepID=UPI00344A8221
MVVMTPSTPVRLDATPRPSDNGLPIDSRHRLGELLAEIAAGDRAAFTEFYHATSHRVFGLAVHIVRSRTIAEDITQEVYLQAWTTADRYDRTRSAPLTWLMMLTHRRAVDLVRAEHAIAARENNYGKTETRRGHDVVAEQVDDHFDHQSIRDNLARLNARERESIALAYYGDHTYREVADLLGIPLPTVKSRIRVGLKQMEVWLSNE